MDKFQNKNLMRALLIFAWLILLVAVWRNLDDLSIAAIVDLTPDNQILAAIALCGLFVLKGLSMALHCGILYGASGILFPMPIAFAVNIVGTVLMFTAPYLAGRRLGTAEAARLREKYPKIQQLRQYEESHPFLISLFARMVFLLPLDPISAYLGAIGTGYRDYILGSCLGLLPAMIAYTAVGSSAVQENNLLLVISVATYILCGLATVAVFYKKSKKAK